MTQHWDTVLRHCPCQVQLLKRMARSSVRTTPAIDCGHLQVCNLLVAILMVKSLMNKHTVPQAVDRLDLALNPVKVKTLPSEDPSELIHQSSRANKGSGGQIVQLQNIEHMQTQTITRDMQLNVATANESLNPLAPLSDKQPHKRRTYPSKGRAGEKACLIFVDPSSDSLTTRFLHPRHQSIVPPLLLLIWLSSSLPHCQFCNFMCTSAVLSSALHILLEAAPQLLFPLRADEGGEMEHGDDHDNFPSQCTGLPIFCKTDIDKISPDEDERVAEEALYLEVVIHSAPMLCLYLSDKELSGKEGTNLYSIPQGNTITPKTRKTLRPYMHPTDSQIVLKSSQIPFYLLMQSSIMTKNWTLCMAIIDAMVSHVPQHLNNYV
ncbi:hypothetical protein BKA83DRAFT_4127716 [Pisolithus microcarpus]|nr:hypothetical protein BKA83DRAFT_4127716 [Pisolithus microcarpus]